MFKSASSAGRVTIGCRWEVCAAENLIVSWGERNSVADYSLLDFGHKGERKLFAVRAYIDSYQQQKADDA